MSKKLVDYSFYPISLLFSQKEFAHAVKKIINCLDLTSGSGGSTSIIEELITTQSDTYQNDDLKNAIGPFYVDLGGVRIYPTLNTTTGTLDNSVNGGFSPDAIITIIYNTDTSSGGGGTEPILNWVSKNTTSTIINTERNIVSDVTAGDIILTLPTTASFDIRVKRIDNSSNELSVTGNIDGTPGTSIIFLPGESYTFSYDLNNLTYYLL